jgi:hypothetical protein
MNMIKSLFFACIAILALAFPPGCSTGKFTAKLNEIDSMIRKVNPDHNCGCDYGDRTISYPNPKNDNANLYFWQAVYIKKDETDLSGQSRKIKDELVKLLPELSKYRRLYLEYRKPGLNPSDTSLKYTVIGSAFFIKDKCNGFVKDISAKQLIKKSHKKKYENDLCGK